MLRAPDGGWSFALGQMDLFATVKLSERWQFLSETIAETGEDNRIGIEVERALVQFLAPGGVRIAAGRYHTSIGFYNGAYHHGLWFQTAASRPRLFAFEDQGGILPVHDVGLAADGPVPLPGAGLRWKAEVGNGRGAPGAEPVQSAVDQDRRKAVNVAVTSRPSALPGLQTGLSAYVDKHGPASTATTTTILAAHLVYQQAPWEWISEYARIRRRPAGGDDANTAAWYVQAARQFGRATPFVRYESTEIDPRDPDIGSFTSARGPSVGLRVDATPAVALKVQYDHRTHGGRAEHTAIGQVAFAF